MYYSSSEIFIDLKIRSGEFLQDHVNMIITMSFTTHVMNFLNLFFSRFSSHIVITEYYVEFSVLYHMSLSLLIIYF